LAGAPQISIPVTTDTYALGLSFLGAPGEDERLLALAEFLAP
jgi:Asp-tRNA(Asn)/Glu-tRNA(Gln) amidotransferase A subunit family amidase